MPAYDVRLFSPPAPVARVTLRDPATGVSVSDVPMLLDTGADVTLMPRSFTDQLSLVSTPEEYELIGFDGSRSLAQAVHLNMEFLGKTFRGKFLLTDQEWGLLGRDVLNHVPLLFDGPRLNWDERRSKVG